MLYSNEIILFASLELKAAAAIHEAFCLALVRANAGKTLYRISAPTQVHYWKKERAARLHALINMKAN